MTRVVAAETFPGSGGRDLSLNSLLDGRALVVPGGATRQTNRALQRPLLGQGDELLHKSGRASFAFLPTVVMIRSCSISAPRQVAHQRQAVGGVTPQFFAAGF